MSGPPGAQDGATHDVIVIGSGVGGYPCAIRAAQLGMRVACVEKAATLGGTCLNVGCIPSKALLQSTERLEEVRHGLAPHGIKVSGVEVDLVAMMARKEKVVADLIKGIGFLFRKNGVELVRGAARIAAPDRVSVAASDGGGTRELTAAKAIVVATGSEVARLPGLEIDEERVVSSVGALSLRRVPRRLAVVGAGYIGLELGSVWRRLGAEVTVVEYLDRIVPGVDGEIATQLHRVLARAGIEFRLSTKVAGARVGDDGVMLGLEPSGGGERTELAADVVLVAVGRRPHTADLGLETVGVALDDKGRVRTDAGFRTNVPGVYAIGDCIAGPMLAHKAEEEGVAAAELIAGQAGHVNYGAIPSVIYTWPEVASVGRTEEELKAAGVAYRAGKFPFSANSRARANGETDGLVKILADARTDRVLGIHIIGPDAGTMIPEAVLAMEFGAAAEDIARTSHAHPTLNEAVKEAALAVEGRTLNL